MSGPASTVAPPGQDELLYLNREEVASLMPRLEVQLDAVEQTYRAAATGSVEMPPKPGIHPRKDSFIHAMPCFFGELDIAGIKWVSGYPTNREAGLPYISGLIILNDAETGLPAAIMDASEITAARTAAASGVCIRRWAPAHWHHAAIIGCGEQGRYHARILKKLRPNVEIRAFDPIPDAARSVSDGSIVAPSVRDAVDGAEVVITAGPLLLDPDPVVSASWLPNECLLLPVDFDALVRVDSIKGCDLFVVDDIAQFRYYRERGYFEGWPDPAGTVGEMIESDRSPPRVACVNLGVGALDVVFAQRVYGVATGNASGTRLAR